MIVGVDFGAPQRARDQRRKIIEVYPGATLRTMGLASYKSRPDEAVRLGIAAGIRPVLAPDPTWQERLVKEWEGAIDGRFVAALQSRPTFTRASRSSDRVRPLRAIPADGRDLERIP